MNKNIISLKDFEITPNENVTERSQNFQSYIDQMEQFGCKISLVEGNRENIKITTPLDLKLAEILVKEK